MKQKIEIIAAEENMKKYLSVINATEEYTARRYEKRESQWEDIDSLFLEWDGVGKEIISFVNSIPKKTEVLIIETGEINYLLKSELLREGALFSTPKELLYKFKNLSENEMKQGENVNASNGSEKVIKKKLSDAFKLKNNLSKEKNNQEIESKTGISLRKFLNSKVDYPGIKVIREENEVIVPIIKKEQHIKNFEGTGYYLIINSDSAFVCYLVSLMLSKNSTVSLVDLTGELNNYFKTPDIEALTKLFDGEDDPVVINPNLYLYSEALEDAYKVQIEKFLEIRELLKRESKQIVFFADSRYIEKMSVLVDKIIVPISEEKIIIGDIDITNLSSTLEKILILINPRIGILSRSEIRDEFENVEIAEIKRFQQNDEKIIYRNIVKQNENASLSTIEKYFEKFMEQFLV